MLHEVFTSTVYILNRDQKVIDHLNSQFRLLSTRYDLLIYKYDSERKDKDKGLRRQAAKIKSLNSKHAEIDKNLRDLKMHLIHIHNLYTAESSPDPKLLAEYTLCTQRLHYLIYRLNSH